MSRVAAALGTVLLTPYLLHHLGAERYGIWLLALTVTFSSGFLSFGDAGLPVAAIRFIAEARARGAESEIGGIVSSLLVLYVPLGFVLGGLLVLLASTFVDLFGIRSDLAQVSVWVFALAGAQVVFDLPAAAFQAVLQGLQRYGAYQAIQVGGTVAWVVGAFAVVQAGHGILGLALVAFVVAFVELVASVVLAFVVDRELRLRLRLVNRRILRRLLGYGSAVLGMRIASILWNQSDRIVIALLVSTAAVAHYQIAYLLQSVVLLSLSVSASAVVPASARVRASGDRNTERAIYLVGTRYAVAICMPILIATLVYIHAIIATWVGPTYVYLSGASRLFVLTLLIPMFSTVGLSMFVGIGRIRPILIVNVVATGINLILSVLLAPTLGITGVILGTLIAFIPANVTYLVLFAKEFGSSARLFLKEIILPNAPGAVAQIAFALATVTWCDQLHKLWQVGAVCAASVMVSGLFFLLCSPPGQRAGLLRLVRRSAAASPTSGPIDPQTWR